MAATMRAKGTMKANTPSTRAVVPREAGEPGTRCPAGPQWRGGGAGHGHGHGRHGRSVRACTDNVPAGAGARGARVMAVVRPIA